MSYNWFDKFSDRARGICSIERADSRDRGPSTGNRGGSGGGSNRGSAGGSGSGSMHQSAISQASRPASAPSSPTQSAAGPGNATTADKYIADKYGLTSDQYDKATRQLRDTVLDARDFQDDGALNTIGKLLLSPFGYYEEDPSLNPSAAQRAWDQSMEDAKNGITRPSDSLANRRIDALQLGTSLAGIGSGVPIGSLYNAGTAMFGHPENFGQINLGPSGGPSTTGKLGGYSDHPGGSTRTGNTGSVLNALAQSGAVAQPNPIAPAPTPPASDPNGALEVWKQIYQPYGGDYATYGSGKEHQFFAPAAMAEGGPVERAGRGGDTTLAHVTPGEIMLPPELYNSDPDLLDHILRSMHSAGMDPSQYMVGGGGEDEENDITGMPQYGFWKTIKKALKHVAPVAIGTGAGVLTGSPIIGGLGGALSSKLFGNSWGEAALSGLGSGALSYFGPQLWDSASSALAPAALSGHQAAISQASGGSGGLFDSALNFVKNNPMQVGGAALAGLAALNSATQKPQNMDLPESPANDPALAEQIRNGQNPTWDRKQTDTSKVNWYQYGEMPEWDYFIDEDKFTPAAGLKRGGLPARGGGALSQLHSAGGMADGPGGGQDDKIPVYLSAKEYVVPADVVSDLGDGNPDHGAKKLDKMRDKVRTQKGRSGFPKKAHATVEKYL